MKRLISLVATMWVALPTFAQEAETDASAVIREAEQRWETAIMKRDS